MLKYGRKAVSLFFEKEFLLYCGKEKCMNILHMKYAVEVANAGSINKASETLLIAQPNLSRSIKEL